MQKAEHDPLQFGAEDNALDTHGAQGTAAEPNTTQSSGAENTGAVLADTQHNPLAPTSQHEGQTSTWQHYPALPTAAVARHEGAYVHQHVQQDMAAAASNSPPARYPSVPIPAVCNISLNSPTASLSSSDTAFTTAVRGVAGQGSNLSSPVAVGNLELKIMVCNPLKHVQYISGIPGFDGAYISFEVTTYTSLPHFSSSRLSVRRRFRDFVSLSNLLPKLLHGSFLPARPPKNMIEARRLTDTFIEERRAALERYLNRLAAHPATARSEALRVFLEAEGNLRSNPQWRCLKPHVLTPAQATSRLIRTLVGVRKTQPTPSEVVQPAGQNRDVYRLLHENLRQLRGSFKHSPLSAEEVALRDDTALVEDEAGALHVALHRGEAWQRSLAARYSSSAQTATALKALGVFEGSYSYGQSETVQALTSMAQALQAASTMSAAAATAASGALQPLRDHHAATPNIMAALHGRERQLLTVMTLRQDLEDKKARLSAAQLTPASQAKKVDALRTVVGQLEVSGAAAEAEYQRQLTRNKEDLAALQAARGTELTAMVHTLASLELAHEQQQQALWQQLLQKLPVPGTTTAYMAQRDLHIHALSSG
eukprot:GHRR01013040.1.p1 GENE.GHRR01013040.1~~GHRR01013040.1.p1  ORF type:complete len:596 (+),score=245.09 GHRR01013040.1:197-1984(+)